MSAKDLLSNHFWRIQQANLEIGDRRRHLRPREAWYHRVHRVRSFSVPKLREKAFIECEEPGLHARNELAFSHISEANKLDSQ